MDNSLSLALSNSGIQVLKPTDPGFTNATLRWSSYKAPQYTAAVVPTSDQEVADIAKAATAAGVPFLATGGRHGYITTLGHLTKGLAVDLSQLNSIDIDNVSGTLTIGPGVKIGDIIGPIEAAGYELPVGSCVSVGVVGATVGAGVGLFQGLFGLMIDSLVSVRLATANGDLVEASKSTNSDLFWGIRGAGANFGIIISATYKLHKAVNEAQVFTADAIWPASMVPAYFEVLETFEGTMSPGLSIVSFVVWDAASNAVISTFVYSGAESQARQILAPFFDLSPPAVRASTVPYSQVPATIVFGSLAQTVVPGNIHDIFGVNVRKFSSKAFIAAFDKFDAFYKAHPAGRPSVAVFETFSDKAMTAVLDDETAYPWRDALGNFMLQMSWAEPGDPVEDAVNDFAREVRQDLAAESGYPDLSVYVSYAHGDETVEQVYGKDKLPRLVGLKKRWDPNNVFAYNHALPTEYPY